MDIGSLPGLRRWACRRMISRIQAVLDDDPAVAPALADLDRMIAHLAACRDCCRAVADYRRLAAALARLARRAHPDPEAARRLTAFADRLLSEERP